LTAASNVSCHADKVLVDGMINNMSFGDTSQSLQRGFNSGERQVGCRKEEVSERREEEVRGTWGAFLFWYLRKKVKFPD
jgi:hypothetical protein